jgi:hypothetical protein
VHVQQSVTDQRARWTAGTDEPLVLAAINRSDATWLTAAAIAADTSLPLERVQMTLDSNTAGVIAAPPEEQGGPSRYSTREHYRARTGILGRYFDALVSS